MIDYVCVRLVMETKCKEMEKIQQLCLSRGDQQEPVGWGQCGLCVGEDGDGVCGAQEAGVQMKQQICNPLSNVNEEDAFPEDQQLLALSWELQQEGLVSCPRLSIP